MTTVAVCALTFRRPHGLDALLTSLAALNHPGAEYDVKVVIVDNDRDGPAEPVVDRWRNEFPWELVYAVEARRGISCGRNKAIRTAGAVDFVAFIDDDEIADPNWLAELLRVQRATSADVVTGPVLPLFEADPPAWAVEGKFFDRPRAATGTERTYATTGNVLIAAHVMPPGDPSPFYEGMVLTGGSDTHFFLRAWLEGNRIVWADEATVEESVPVSRMNARWLLRREYRRGNTLSLCLRDLQDTPWRRIRRVGLAGISIVRGSAESLVAVFQGKAAVIIGLRRIMFGAGLLTGLFGVKFKEYATTIHGS